MFSQMPINMKITFLLLGTHDQRFASVTLFAKVYLLFCTMYGNIVITDNLYNRTFEIVGIVHSCLIINLRPLY